MAYLSCLECGKLSDSSYCYEHRKTKARGYGSVHRTDRKKQLETEPFCHFVCENGEVCGSVENLQRHHTYGKNNPDATTILCRYHNRLIGKPGYKSKV